ncbi:MAG: 6-phosphogluconolactonase [Nitrospiraceae bacterium]|jgi:6-phosphogluconolactonase|nr:6-phosphogluconolactonase [Nitrospiraceae bacterium]
MTAGSDSTHSAKDHQDPGMIPSFMVWSTPDELAREGAILFRELLKKDVLSRNTSAVVLSGGNSPRGLFGEMGKLLSVGCEDWIGKVEWFEGDERMVPPTHPRSNFRMIRETLLDPLGISPHRIHRIMGEASVISEEALRYAHEIMQVMGAPGPHLPVMDYVFLGIGPDGHTASLFPGTFPELEHHQLVVSAPATNEREARISMGYHLLAHARHLIFLVMGEEKRTVLDDILLRMKPSPVQELLLLRAELGQAATFWVDRSALSENLARVVKLMS